MHGAAEVFPSHDGGEGSVIRKIAAVAEWTTWSASKGAGFGNGSELEDCCERSEEERSEGGDFFHVLVGGLLGNKDCKDKRKLAVDEIKPSADFLHFVNWAEEAVQEDIHDDALSDFDVHADGHAGLEGDFFVADNE